MGDRESDGRRRPPGSSGPLSRLVAGWRPAVAEESQREGFRMGSVVKKRRKRMAKKKHRKLLRKTRVQRRRLGK
ncbi:hypothetical protein GCM10022251_06750 [Phytohabitans flavus]|uniref:Ribosomal protein mS38 C-terminal domain-containing protein n=1 Tax=Phytohabitans flavus TaxID=1076124 RepID=A0A6F8Y204_9ACTN|nr:hypothetical protein Pflav_065620 [Phytohabitans flavus]